MDGVMRQPINTASLSAYLTSYVPEIALPIDVSQVLSSLFRDGVSADDMSSLATVNQTLPTN